jgi:hypothetical protein
MQPRRQIWNGCPGTVPDFSQKVKKPALKNLESLNLEYGTNFFAKKGKNSKKIELQQSPTSPL